MRLRALALGLALAVAAGPAMAETWTDPQGRFSFEKPAGWPAETPVDRGAATELVIGAADYECWFYYVSRPESAAASPDTFVRANSAPLTAEQWVSSTRPFAPMRPAPGSLGGGTASDVRVDTTGYFPRQRATLQNGNRQIMAGLTVRPGAEIWTLCLSYDRTDRTAVFNQVIDSVGTPQDAALEAAGAAAAAARAAAPTPAATPEPAPPAPPPPPQRRGRGGARDR
jgi:hypothetical protein